VKARIAGEALLEATRWPADGSDFEPLWEAEDVARVLRVPVRWVREATRDGRLPHVSIGRYKRYSPSAIRGWIKAQSVPARGTK
jgi:excisionase family DNA binding protein